MSAKTVLKAEARELSTKGEINELRASGKVPAIIYGAGKPEIKISIEARELLIERQKGRFFSKPLDVDNGKEVIRVIPQDIQLHPVKENTLHVDFLRVDGSSKVRVAVPVVFTNIEKSPGVKRGGILNTVRRTIDVLCKVDDIPEFFTADVGGKKIKDNIKFSDLEIPEGVEPVIQDRDFTIATIVGRIAKEETTSTEVDASAEGEEDNEESKEEA